MVQDMVKNAANGSHEPRQENERTPLIAHRENTHVSDDDRPLPKLQLFLLCLAKLTEPVAFFSIFPFVNQMVYETGIPREQCGFYTGLIESLFSLIQFLIMPVWGRYSDRVRFSTSVYEEWLISQICTCVEREEADTGSQPSRALSHEHFIRTVAQRLADDGIQVSIRLLRRQCSNDTNDDFRDLDTENSGAGILSARFRWEHGHFPGTLDGWRISQTRRFIPDLSAYKAVPRLPLSAAMSGDRLACASLGSVVPILLGRGMSVALS